MDSFVYAVKRGRKPGVYTDWADCAAQVNGYSGAIYQKFSVYDIDKAREFAKSGESTGSKSNSKKSKKNKRKR